MNLMIWAVIILAMVAVVLAVIIIRLIELGNKQGEVWAKQRDDFINRIMSVDYVRYYATKPPIDNVNELITGDSYPPAYSPWTDEQLAGTVQPTMPEWKEDAFKDQR